MKKSIILTVLTLLTIFLVGVASAKTLVAGKIYNADYTATIADANVTVVCNLVINSTTSLSDGIYAVTLSTLECPVGSNVTVSAVKGDLYGEKTGTVWDGTIFDIPMDIAVVNVPLIPEFGLVVGLVTVLSAVAVFFIIRRK